MTKSGIILTLFLVLFGGNLFSQEKIGYVDSKVILDGLQDAKDAQANLDNVVLQWKKDLQSYSDSLTSVQTDYEKKKLILTDKVRLEREDQIKNLEKRISDYKLQKFGENGEYFQKQNELMK